MAFAREYIRDYNVVKAAERAGFQGPYGYTLLRMPDIRAEIERIESELLDEVRKQAGVSLKRTLTELAKLAFYDPRKLFNEDGSPKDVHDLPDDVAAAIEGIDVEERWEGKGQERVFAGYVRKIKLAKRGTALNDLLRHLGAFKDDNTQKGDAAGKALASGIADLLQGIQATGSALGVVKKPPPDADVVDV